MPYVPSSPFIDANETYNYERSVLGKGKVVLDLRGSKLEQKILTSAVNQSRLLEQIKAIEGRSACAGIRNNDTAAYTARVNHYGGISSWGMTLPIRRWVDSAYSDTKVALGGYGVVRKNFSGRNSKAIAEYLNKWLQSKPNTDRGFIKRRVSYDEFVGTNRYKRWEADFFKRYPFYTSYETRNRPHYEGTKFVNREDSLEEQARKRKANALHNQMRVKELNAMSVGGLGLEFDIVEDGAPEAGLFGNVTTSKGSTYQISPSAFMKGLASKMASNQRRAIRNMQPGNAESTKAIKGRDEPLVWTGEMYNSIESWVE